MKRFVIHAIIFATLVGLFFIIAEFYVEKNAYKHDDIAWKALQFKERKDSIHTIFIGSSLTNSAIEDSRWATEALNLGLNGATMGYEYYIADAVLPHLPNLKVVVVEIGYQTLRDDRDFHGNFTSCIGWERPTVYFHTRKYSRLSSHGFEFFDPVRFREKLFNNFHEAGEFDIDRFIDSPDYLRDAPSRLAEGESSAAFFTKDSTYYSYNLQLLERIIEMVQERGAEVALCAYPVLEEYTRFMDPDQLNEMYSTVAMLQKKYGIQFFDYYMDKRFGAMDFYDISHLNHGEGRKKFTKIFSEELIKK